MVVSADTDAMQWELAIGGERSTTTARVLDPLYELESASAKEATVGVDPDIAPRGICLDRQPVADR